MKRTLLIGLATAVLCSLAKAQESAPASSPQKLRVEKLEGSLHALGEIRFDVAKRTIRFPASVNMNEGAIEFALVGTQGKTHESIFATDIRPIHLRAVMSLLNVEPTPAEKTGNPEPKKAPAPSFVDVEVSWASQTEEGKAAAADATKAQTVSLRKCVAEMHFERPSPTSDEKVTLKPLPKGSWEYTGSRVDDLGFEAERELDFIAVQKRLSALFNLPYPNTDRDDLWQANGKVLPAIGTPVTITIRLPQAGEAKE